ncbi:hypothetical protein [Nissabacter sp. SGAir0207]|uniref:hypothetical protein n=1 Tax=Nissabacter sp. SGAir0207 TaxID=2126321 RepID=UPI0010CD5369|nr:hypothetical protein [Nissabacter sp. SGAir0207]QCR38759.1 hypothetical protein C1N62_21770 [Nissabacter sp. SGAir0207]
MQHTPDIQPIVIDECAIDEYPTPDVLTEMAAMAALREFRVPALPGDYLMAYERIQKQNMRMRIDMALHGIDMLDEEMVLKRHGWLMNSAVNASMPL